MRNKNKWGQNCCSEANKLIPASPADFLKEHAHQRCVVYVIHYYYSKKKNLVLEICKAAEQETKHSSCSISAASLPLIKAADSCFPVAPPCKHYGEFKGGTHGACNEVEEWGLVLCVRSYQPVCTRQSRQCEISPAFPRSPFKMHNFIYSCSSTGCVRVCVNPLRGFLQLPDWRGFYLREQR